MRRSELCHLHDHEDVSEKTKDRQGLNLVWSVRRVDIMCLCPGKKL